MRARRGAPVWGTGTNHNHNPQRKPRTAPRGLLCVTHLPGRCGQARPSQHSKLDAVAPQCGSSAGTVRAPVRPCPQNASAAAATSAAAERPTRCPSVADSWRLARRPPDNVVRRGSRQPRSTAKQSSPACAGSPMSRSAATQVRPCPVLRGAPKATSRAPNATEAPLGAHRPDGFTGMAPGDGNEGGRLGPLLQDARGLLDSGAPRSSLARHSE